jgi:Tfp pilus assembly protein PilX
MIAVVPQRSRTKSWVLVVLLLLLLVVGSISYLGWRQSVPGVRATLTAPRFLGRDTAVTATLDAARGHVRRAELRLVQAGNTITLAKAEGALGRRAQLPVTVASARPPWRCGAATISGGRCARASAPWRRSRSRSS